MQILFIVLNDLTFLEEILSKFVELKLRGATIIDSEGMASAMLRSEGLHALLSGPFARSLENDQGNSKTLFTVIPEADKVNEAVSEIQKIMAKSKKQVIGFMFTMPVSGIYPLRPKAQ